MQHCLGIDYESWTNDPGAFGTLTSQDRRQLDGEATRRHGYALLDLLRRESVRATWFVVGEVAEWYPDVIAAIQQAGHEIGYHTHFHPHALTADRLREELRASAPFLHRYRPEGFQAPRIYLPKTCYAILEQAGFRYSSSMYGDTAAPLMVRNIVELPVSTAPWFSRWTAPPQWPRSLTWRLLCREVPYGSSLFLGLVGARGVSHWICRRAAAEKRSNVFIHNWQLYDSGPSERTFRRRLCLRNPLNWPYARRVLAEFTKLLREFSFGPLCEVLPRDAAAVPRYC